MAIYLSRPLHEKIEYKEFTGEAEDEQDNEETRNLEALEFTS